MRDVYLYLAIFVSFGSLVIFILTEFQKLGWFHF